MTPKEKAQELFDRFNSPDRTNYPYIHNAQQCALIAVDFAREFITGDLSESFDKTMYLFEVKQEIEKL